MAHGGRRRAPVLHRWMEGSFQHAAALLGEGLDLEDDVVLDVDHVGGDREVVVEPLVRPARRALEVLDRQRLVGVGGGVVGRRVDLLQALAHEGVGG